jgi:hypothetical protein
VLITQPRTPSALVGPPWLAGQPPCVLHSRAYAPPSRGLALRHCLHGSPRLILAVHIRDRAPPKSLPLMRADRTWPPLPPRPTPAAADRPLAAIFHLSVCRLSCCSTLPYSSGGRLSATVGRQSGNAVAQLFAEHSHSSTLANSLEKALNVCYACRVPTTERIVMSLQFEWDDAKARQNQAKHKISFEEAETIFSDPFLVTYPDDTHSEHEDRFLSIG